MNKIVKYASVFVIIVVIIILVSFNINKGSEEVRNMGGSESIMKVVINDKEYDVRYEDNETSREFMKLLPSEYEMTELNGNEKYVYLDKELPVNYNSSKDIKEGDIMLYQSDCLVIFYKSFRTSYNYTKIGHIDNLEELSGDNIIVRFNK